MSGHTCVLEQDGKNSSPQKISGSSATALSKWRKSYRLFPQARTQEKSWLKKDWWGNGRNKVILSSCCWYFRRNAENQDKQIKKTIKLPIQPSKVLHLGKNVLKSKAQKSLSKLVNVGWRSASKGIKERANILSGEKKSWLDLSRKIRGDAISTENKQLIFNFWSYEASRSTGDKRRCHPKENREEAANGTCEARAGKKRKQRSFRLQSTTSGNKD